LKPGAAEVVERLKAWGLDVAVVSGDRRAAVEAVAAQAGIERVVADVFPAGKVEEVRRLQAEGRRVAFVGDGINDAPALAQADLGIALGTGTDVAKEAGDVLILGGDLARVALALQLARRTFWIIAQNLTWAFAYNAILIPLAVVGTLSPLAASAAMAVSSVSVVGNALRLRRFARNEAAPAEAHRRPLPLVIPPAEPSEPRPAEQHHVRRPGEDAPKVLLREDVRRLARSLGRLYERRWDG
jgi:cation-transporting ATPase V